jgi:tetratricopeptide (TPR) repeat protein
MSNLALVHDRLGDTRRGLELLQEAMALAESRPNPSRMTLLSLANNIGATFQDLSEDREAAPYLRRSAELAEEVLGPDHPSTLTILGNLAGLEVELGDAETGRALYRRVVEQHKVIVGENAASTIAAEHGYWTAVAKTKAHREAVDGFAELLAKSERALGTTHWLTIQTRASLARAHLDLGEIEPALELARRAENEFRAQLGEDHHRTKSAKAIADEAATQHAGEGASSAP